MDGFSILRKNDLVSSTFEGINIKNRILDILKNRYQESYPKSKLDLPNVGTYFAEKYFHDKNTI